MRRKTTYDISAEYFAASKVGVIMGGKHRKEVSAKGRLSQRLFAALDMPINADPFIPETVIMIGENMTLGINKCKKILLYRDDLVRLRIGGYILEVRGKCFMLKSGQSGSLEISGIIGSIEFITSEGRDT